MSLVPIQPEEARKLIEAGALLVDVREADEHARERIVQSRNAPLSRSDKFAADGAQVVFYCKSGARTRSAAARLAGSSDAPCYLLEGGIDAWKKAGLPIEKSARAPLPMMRQVQIVAGSLVLGGVLLGAVVHPGFYALSGFVGAGLIFAGVSGTCMMARLLDRMPWNRNAAAI